MYNNCIKAIDKGWLEMPRKIQKNHQRQHSKETKLEAVKQVLEEGRPRFDVVSENQISLGTLNNWLKRYIEEGEMGLEPKRIKPSTKEPIDEELARLRDIEKKYNEQLEDIEILKKFRASLEAKANPYVSKKSSN